MTVHTLTGYAISACFLGVVALGLACAAPYIDIHDKHPGDPKPGRRRPQR